MACECKPGGKLCKSCLQSVYERNAVSSAPLYNPNGEYTLAQVDVFEKQFKDNIVDEVSKSPLAIASQRYPDFYEVVEEINKDLKEMKKTGK